MRLPISSVIASLFVALTTPNSPAVAQQGFAESTVRLASAGEGEMNYSDRDSNPLNDAQTYDPPPVQMERQSEIPSGPVVAPPAGRTPARSPMVNQTKMPAGFYPSAEARATLDQFPEPSPVQRTPRLQPARRGGKPFQGIQSQSTISPYLYMNAGSSTATPITNYLAFVRPEQEKEESIRQQRRELQQLRTQVQKMSSATGTNMRQTGAAHYMDTAQFYRGLQR